MKTELQSYKESNAQQSLQIMSLRDDIKNLQDLIASLMKIKVLKNTNSQNLGRGSWDLTERVIDLENRLREHLVEREKSGRKADLEKRWPCSGRFSPCMNLKEPENSLDIFPVKKTEALQQEIQTLTKKLEQLYLLYEEAAERSPHTEASYTGQKRPLQHLEGQAAVNSILLDMGRKKDKTIERLRQSVTKVETVNERTAAKADNLKTPSDSAEQAARSEKERVYQMPARGPPEHSTTRSTLKGVSGREQEVSHNYVFN
ncbi:testis expressed gene 21 [Cricetulus griseus]